MWYINEENHQYLVVIVAKSSEKITSCTLISTLTLLAPGSNLPLLAPGGICPPPPWDKLPGNSKLVRAEGPGFWDFYFNLVLHVSAKNWDISMIR